MDSGKRRTTELEMRMRTPYRFRRRAGVEEAPAVRVGFQMCSVQIGGEAQPRVLLIPAEAGRRWLA